MKDLEITGSRLSRRKIINNEHEQHYFMFYQLFKNKPIRTPKIYNAYITTNRKRNVFKKVLLILTETFVPVNNNNKL